MDSPGRSRGSCGGGSRGIRRWQWQTPVAAATERYRGGEGMAASAAGACKASDEALHSAVQHRDGVASVMVLGNDDGDGCREQQMSARLAPHHRGRMEVRLKLPHP